MELILARHGNTFTADQTSVWIGANEDLPLVATGIYQAQCLGNALRHSAITLNATYCGPLQRMLDYAEVVLKTLLTPQKPQVDRRLNEIDYGPWGGLTSDQIRARFGSTLFDDWNRYSRWPEPVGWGGSAQILTEEVQAFATELLVKHQPHETILVVTSNGRLRYFLNLILGAFAEHVQQHNFKVATGHICRLVYRQRWSLEAWNLPPTFGLRPY